MDSEKSEKEIKMFLVFVISITFILLFGILSVIFMPEIKDLFNISPKPKFPRIVSFTENDRNIEVNQYEEFEIRFQVQGEEFGEGWALLDNYNQDLISIVEGGYHNNNQEIWKFCCDSKGTSTLHFQKGDDLTKIFKIEIN